jgi:ribosomal protein S27E
MSMHRMKCRNAKCIFDGMMEAKSDRPFVKKAFLDKKKADMKAKGITPPSEVMQIRCPKCGTRWRMRAEQLR